jgi:hypothetical protein
LGQPIEVGPYAVIVPCGFADLPRSDFADDALPLFVSKHQAAGMDTGPVVTVAPSSQRRAADRLTHILWQIRGALPPMIVVGLGSAGESIAAAVARVGADDADTASLPVLAVLLWAFPSDDRQSIRLPFLPAA